MHFYCREIARFKNPILHMIWAFEAWHGLAMCRVQAVQCSAQGRPSIVPQKRNRSRRLKSCEVALGGRRDALFFSPPPPPPPSPDLPCQARTEKAFRRIGSQSSSPSSTSSTIHLIVGRITQQWHLFISTMVFPFANVCSTRCKYRAERKLSRWLVGGSRVRKEASKTHSVAHRMILTTLTQRMVIGVAHI